VSRTGSVVGDSLKLLEQDGIAPSSFHQFSIVSAESFIGRAQMFKRLLHRARQ